MQPNSSSTMLPTTPAFINAARTAAGIQAGLLTGFSCLALALALVLHAGENTSDSSWNELGAVIAFAAFVWLVVPLLLVGVPLLLLRRGRPGARVALIVGESLSIGYYLLGTDRFGFGGAGGPFVVWFALATMTIIALLQPGARAWSVS